MERWTVGEEGQPGPVLRGSKMAARSVLWPSAAALRARGHKGA